MSTNNNFLEFSKPFLDSLKETFQMMIQTEIKPHTPVFKKDGVAKGDISAMIGMNGLVEREGVEKTFKGLLVISFAEEVYVKMASRMLMEEFTEYNDENGDAGSEIANIVMGNAKKGLTPQGYKIDMATPSTVRGKSHELKYPSKTTVIEIEIKTDIGSFSLEICYQEHKS